MKLEISLDQYLLTIDVHAYEKAPALGKWADSDQDCYGYDDLDYTVESVIELDEDDIPYDLSQEQIDEMLRGLEHIVERKVIEMLEDQADY